MDDELNDDQVLADLQEAIEGLEDDEDDGAELPVEEFLQEARQPKFVFGRPNPKYQGGDGPAGDGDRGGPMDFDREAPEKRPKFPRFWLVRARNPRALAKRWGIDFGALLKDKAFVRHRQVAQSLISKGRRPSPERITKILGRDADRQSISEAFDVTDTDPTMELTEAADPAEMAEAKFAGEESLSDRDSAVHRAWRALRNSSVTVEGGASSWVMEVYEDKVIVCTSAPDAESQYSAIPYKVSKDGAITFDIPAAERVERLWSIAEAAVLGRFEDLAEASDGATELAGTEWDVTIIEAGLSDNGKFYPPEVLKQAAPLFEGKKVLARSDEAHLGRTDKSVEKIVGWIDGVKYVNGSLRARLHISEAASWLRTMLVDAWKRGKKDLVGLSLTGAATTLTPALHESKRVWRVNGIRKVETVDIVVDPAAGGGLLKLVAAKGKEDGPMADQDELEGLTLEQLKEVNPDLYAGLLAEAQAAGTSTEDTPTAPAAGTPAAPSTALAEAQEDDDVVPKALGRVVVGARLAETSLPKVSKNRITKRFANRSFTGTELEEAVQDEIDLFAELEKENLVTTSVGGTRETQVEVGLEEAQRAKTALDGFFAGRDLEIDGERVPRYRSFKQAYMDLTGDGLRDGVVRGQLSEAKGGKWALGEHGGRVELRLHEAVDGEALLSEAVQSTTWAEALGDSIRRQMLREYKESDLRTWEPLVDTRPAVDFRTHRAIRIGGYANLPTVAQNAAYAALTSPGDEEATYAVTKRGGLETVTIEAIANDDVQAIRRIPRKMARSAAQTLHEFVFDFLATNANIYDTTALFTVGHANLGSSALSASSLKAARARMRKQTDMSNSKRLGLIPKELWVPVDLEDVAYEVTNSDRKPGTADNDVNFVKAMGLRATVVDYWTDTNNWFVTASKDQTPLIELAFYGSEEPELFTQDNPNVGDLFTNDRIVYKIRFIFGGAVADFRGFDGSLVA